MEEQELRNFLRSEGEQLTEVPVPTIDITEDTLQDICDGIDGADGLDCLIQNLGTVANAFKTENGFSCSSEVLTEAVKVMERSLVRLYMEITANQGNVKGSLANVDRQLKHKYRKYMAVLFFLIYKSFEDIERAVTEESHNISIQMAAKESGRRRKKQMEELEEESKFRFWFEWRPRILENLLKVLAPPMDEVWESNSNPDGYNFVRCITLALCTTIKNKSKRLRNMDGETEYIFDILGVLASKHNEETGITPRLIPLLKGSEETASIVAKGVHRMLEHCSDKAQTIVLQVLTEAYNVYTTRFDKESGQERGFHVFLTQLCKDEPRGALNSLPIIIQFLDAESHTVRNAVLVIAHELMQWTWEQMNQDNSLESEEDRDARDSEKEKWPKVRETLLNEILLRYMKDVNSLVRSKAVNLLSDLVEKKKIYPAEGVELMKNVRLRLLDKTVTTRKAATGLVVELVKLYPHSVLPAAKFEEKRREKIEEICSKIRQDESNPAHALYFIIKEFFLHIQLYGFVLSPEIKDKVTTQDVALTVLEQYLKDGNYWLACETLHYCMRKWTEIEEQLIAMNQGDNNTPDHLYITFFKITYPDVFPQQMDSLELNELNYLAPSTVEAARNFLGFTQACFKMQMELQKCQPSLKKLLELGTTTDKKEAVLFFAAICAAKYEPPHSITVSIINALAQLSPDELTDFVEPFKFIFIGGDRISPVGVIKKLIQLVHSLSELSESLVESLSGMIGEFYRSGLLTSESVKILWDAFSLTTRDWTPDDSRSAAYIIGIIGQIERKVVTSNLNQLIEVGLGQRGLEDYELAKVTLQTILFGCRKEQEYTEPDVAGPSRGKSKAPKALNGRSGATEGLKFPPSEKLFSSIVDLIEHGLKVEGNSKMNLMYPRVVELSMQIIYRMCTSPSEVVGRFLPNIHGYIFGGLASSQTALDTQSQNPSQGEEVQSQDQESQSQGQQQDRLKMTEKLMFRYMSFGKALLGAHILYYEQIVTKTIKERKQAMEKVKKKKQTGSRPRASRLSNGNSSLSSSNLNHSNQDSSEMDVMIGTIGFDAEADQIKTYVAKLLDTGFFRQFRVHVFFLCQNFSDIKTLNLKIAVVQALAKLMLVCEASVIKSIDVLVKLWKGDEPFAVKLEILRASIRLTVKFPNQMEKINDCFSDGLAHKDARVRKACMDYIQYLALSDLLKVREQLSDTAACLCDNNFELKEMARDFINQIAEKDNVLQNCIPDIISRLSAREDISQESFQIIMKTLLTKIKKEKQLGGLVERIVWRFKGPVSVRVCQDTAFCLTQIQQNEKTLKVLKDNLNHYSDKLADDLVWDCFMEILTAIKKLGKPELKMRWEEWEKDLEEHHAKCVATDQAEQAARKKHEKPQRRRMAEESSSEDDAEAENDGGENSPEDNAEGSQENGEEAAATATTSSSSAVPPTNNGSDNEDEEEEDEEDKREESPPPQQRRRTRARSPPKRSSKAKAKSPPRGRRATRNTVKVKEEVEDEEMESENAEEAMETSGESD